MHHALPAILSAVVHNTEAVLKALRPGDLGNGLKAFGNVERVFFVNFQRTGDMLFWYDENMHRSLWIDIAEGKNILVLIHLRAGDLSGKDRAEKAIVQHSCSLPSDFFRYKFLDSSKCLIQFP